MSEFVNLRYKDLPDNPEKPIDFGYSIKIKRNKIKRLLKTTQGKITTLHGTVGLTHRDMDYIYIGDLNVLTKFI
jgi:hypothetical protein